MPKTKKRSYKRTVNSRNGSSTIFEPYSENTFGIKLLSDLELAAYALEARKNAHEYLAAAEAYEREIIFRHSIKANS